MTAKLGSQKWGIKTYSFFQLNSNNPHNTHLTLQSQNYCIFFSLQEHFHLFLVLLPLLRGNAMQVIIICLRHAVSCSCSQDHLHLKLGPRVSLRLSQALTHQPPGVDYSFEGRRV